mmetsp:Transcript_18697/g.59361  ORF Transcript_18697/g.59361 Transcript_18697/m.59361 type:complete len:245 (-) Transcript_18697:197-931(-)
MEACRGVCWTSRNYRALGASWTPLSCHSQLPGRIRAWQIVEASWPCRYTASSTWSSLSCLRHRHSGVLRTPWSPPRKSTASQTSQHPACCHLHLAGKKDSQGSRCRRQRLCGATRTPCNSISSPMPGTLPHWARRPLRRSRPGLQRGPPMVALRRGLAGARTLSRPWAGAWSLWPGARGASAASAAFCPLAQKRNSWSGSRSGSCWTARPLLANGASAAPTRRCCSRWPGRRWSRLRRRKRRCC